MQMPDRHSRATPHDMEGNTVLAGATGGARFLQGLHAIADDVLPGARVTVVAIPPTISGCTTSRSATTFDKVMYTIGDGLGTKRRWGRPAETWSGATEVAEYGMGSTWFDIGDRVATHLVRDVMIRARYSLSQVTVALGRRWLTLCSGEQVRLLARTAGRVETRVAVTDADAPSRRRVFHFQEYWVRLRASVPAETLVFVGLGEAKPGRGVLVVSGGADLVVLPPSNAGRFGRHHPRRSGRARGGPRDPRPVVGVSPIVGACHVQGMVQQMLSLGGRRGQRWGGRPSLRRPQ